MHLTVGTHVPPGPDSPARARIGALATPPSGLLDTLETHLGFTAPRPSQTDRIAALVPHLQSTPGYDSRSVQADPWGTAKRLLHDHAALALEGWSGQPISTRWDTLWEVTRHVGPCEGERWHAVAAALEQSPDLPLTQITLVDPRPTLPGAIRRVLDLLEARGVALTPWAPAPTERSGDLARALHEPFAPAGDASLQLIRPAGPREGADDLAAWLRPLLQRDDPCTIPHASASRRATPWTSRVASWARSATPSSPTSSSSASPTSTRSSGSPPPRSSASGPPPSPRSSVPAKPPPATSCAPRSSRPPAP